ncbi:hypothetical protein [Azotobacter armeniacus]
MDASITTNHSSRGFELLAIGSSLLLLIAILLFAWLDPEEFAKQLAKDGSPEGAGAFEHLTVIVLIPGILLGLHAFWAYRDRLPLPILGYWLLAWSLACVYFAGEEVSWGQWYFGWSTPDFLARVNDQGETNLHNMSSWLDQKPRLLVELFLLTGGFLIPLWRLAGKRGPIISHGAMMATAEPWILPQTALLPAGLLFAVTRIAGWLPHSALDDLGSSELREFAVAWFLMWYLISYAVRMKRLSPAGPARP